MKLLLRTVSAAALVIASPAIASDFSFTGSFNDPNDVQLFNFTVGATSTVTLRTWSYAGGTNAAGQVISRGGFDPILALFDSSGNLVGQNDDGGSFVAPDAVTGAQYDTYFSALLGPGTYTTSVMAYSNFAVGPNLSNGFQGGGSFVDATGNQRNRNWAFDILNVNGATQGGVPEPSVWAMLILGMGAIGGAMRRRTAFTVRYA
jgi:hypothetical protein